MAHLFALLGIALIALSPIYVALASVSPVTAAFFRCFYALPVLYLLWSQQRGEDLRPPRARRMAFAAGLLLGVDLSFWHESIELIGAGLATVLANTQVVFVGLLGWALYRERPKAASAGVVGIVLLGVALISGLGNDAAYGDAPGLGTLFGLLSGLTYAFFLLMLRSSNRSRVPASGPLLDATAGGAAVTLALGLFFPGFDLRPSWPAHGFLLALALGSQVAGWLIITHTLPRLPALETSILLLAQPTLALLLAALFLGERIAALQGLGIFLVIGGLAYASLSGAVVKRT